MSAKLTDTSLNIYSDSGSTATTALLSTSSSQLKSLTCQSIIINSSGYSGNNANINKNGFYSVHGSVTSDSTNYASIPLTTAQTNSICLLFVATSALQNSIYQFSWFKNIQNGSNGGNANVYLSNATLGWTISGDPDNSDWKFKVNVGGNNITVKYNIVKLGGSTFSSSLGNSFNWSDT